MYNSKGQEVIPCLYDETIYSAGKSAWFKKNGKYGFINPSSQLIVPCVYDNLFAFFSDSLAAVSKDGKWGFIDTRNQTILPHIYDYAYSFVDGLAKVEKNGKVFYINREGVEYYEA